MGIIKGVVLTVSASAMMAGTVSACGLFRFPEPQDYGITNVIEKGDSLSSFTGQIGACDVDGFLTRDKELLWVRIIAPSGGDVIPGGVELTRSNILTTNPAVQHYCGV